jgi:hypothetical protein
MLNPIYKKIHPVQLIEKTGVCTDNRLTECHEGQGTDKTAWDRHTSNHHYPPLRAYTIVMTVMPVPATPAIKITLMEVAQSSICNISY